MANLTAELYIVRKADVAESAATMKQLKGVIDAWLIPDYATSKIKVPEVAKELSQHGNVACTLTCRGIKNTAHANAKIEALARAKCINEILAVTGDEAKADDIRVHSLIRLASQTFKTSAAIVFSRKKEAARMHRKLKNGAVDFFTQPVFPSNGQLLVKTCKGLKRLIPVNKKMIHTGVLIPFNSRLCRKLAKNKKGFITDTSFLKQLKAGEARGKGYEATVNIAQENLKAALLANAQLEQLGFSTGIHLYGLRKYGNKEPKRLLRDVLKMHSFK
ncbi:hypothetical protein HYU18_05260 [Candidatus Woesearchaeota archaeon]|nr:hypothetical protein [Candidatus Woesearchaeota archaeon]